MPKYTIHFSNKTDRDLARLREGGRLVVENNRDKTKTKLLPI